MFYNNITLHDNKRCVLKKDQERIKKITQKIRECTDKKKCIDILKANFRIIYDKKHIITGKNVVALNRTCDWVNSLIHKPLGGEVYYQGLELICRKTISINKQKLISNNTYEILDIKNDIFKLSDGDSEFEINKNFIYKYFKLSYAKTCHSYQGLSENEPITIFDINHFMVDINWIYTAITRCTNLDNITIYLGKTPYEENIVSLRNQINNMISCHKMNDIKSNRKIEYDKYVDVDWTMNELKKGNKCSECHKYLDISQPECFSIDRIDNNIAHYEFNCRIICRRCNCAKK
jgi:hypothetical protein